MLARLQFEAVNVNVELRSDGALSKIRVLSNNNAPGIIEEFASVFRKKAGSGSRIDFTLPALKIQEHRARVSYLRAAYLAVFAVFGYSVVASRSFDGVRRQIREPDKEHLLQFFYRHDDLYRHEVGVIEQPPWHSSIVVLMGNYRITLPLDDAGIYERLAERAAVGGGWTIRCVRPGWPSWPEYPMYFCDRALARGEPTSGRRSAIDGRTRRHPG